jgi:NADH pyrophosphatase NudC (nudix superfamily)
MTNDEKRIKLRFCGYCGDRLNCNWEYFSKHLHECEDTEKEFYNKT